MLSPWSLHSLCLAKAALHKGYIFTVTMIVLAVALLAATLHAGVFHCALHPPHIYATPDLMLCTARSSLMMTKLQKRLQCNSRSDDDCWSVTNVALSFCIRYQCTCLVNRGSGSLPPLHAEEGSAQLLNDPDSNACIACNCCSYRAPAACNAPSCHKSQSILRHPPAVYSTYGRDNS